jgi:hypothetical protein
VAEACFEPKGTKKTGYAPPKGFNELLPPKENRLKGGNPGEIPSSLEIDAMKKEL